MIQGNKLSPKIIPQTPWNHRSFLIPTSSTWPLCLAQKQPPASVVNFSPRCIHPNLTAGIVAQNGRPEAMEILWVLLIMEEILHQLIVDRYLVVSKNRGTPKSSVLVGFSIINHPFWGTPIFRNTIFFTRMTWHVLAWNRFSSDTSNTVDGRNPKQPPEMMYKNPVNNGIKIMG